MVTTRISPLIPRPVQSNYPIQIVQNHCYPIRVRNCLLSPRAISTARRHTLTPVLGNSLLGQELQPPSTLFLCLQSGCLLEQRHLDVVLVAGHRLQLAPLQFYVVVLLTTPLLLLRLMAGSHLLQAH